VHPGRLGRTLVQQLSDPGRTSAAAGARAPGKQTWVQALGVPAPGAARSDEQVHQAAAAAIRGPGGRLPFLDQIQRAFGRHDVSHIVAHTDDAAAAGARAMGAEAFASGHHVAFAGAPSLHTAAHEAAHVVQQAGGVQLRGGVGAVGDRYEHNADAVADAVVRGASAEPLLDPFAGGSAPAAAPPVQRAVVGGARYGNMFTNTQDPDFELFTTREAAEQRALAQVAAWGANPSNNDGALARLTANHQAKPSVWRRPDEIAALTLDAFDGYAREQADWITGTSGTGDALFSPEQKLAYRSLLALARKDNRRILNACGQFTVATLLAQSLGSSPAEHDPRFDAYAKGVAGTGLTAIESPAATAQEADDWGRALLTLGSSPKLTPAVASQVIPQRPEARALKQLVDEGAVTPFVTYVNGRDVVLHANNGAEVTNFCEFRNEGGNAATYNDLAPQLRNVHRYTVACLDALRVHRARPRGVRPLTVIMQTALDHNGVTYRNAHVTDLVTRPNRTTIIVESLASLGDFAGAAETLAARHKTDGKVDEILITGHGESQSMGLAASKQTGEYTAAREDVGLESISQRLMQALREVDTSRAAFRAVLQASPLVTDKSVLPADRSQAYARIRAASIEDRTLLAKLKTVLAGLPGMPAHTLTDAAQAFVDRLMTVMRDDAATSRIVLHACLTGSNQVLVDIDGAAPVATQQAAIKAAIARDPSLVTKIESSIPRKYLLWGKKGVSVLGANASVYGRTTELQDPGTGQISLRNPGDDQLTAPSKRAYARHGIEPEGALRATVEAWAEDQGATITALGQRIAAAPSTAWNEVLIRALYARIVATPNNGALIIALERASGALANLVAPDEATVASVQGKVPGPHANAVFTALTGAAAWGAAPYWFTRVVLYQVWLATDAGKRADLLATLTAAAAAGNTDTQRLSKYLDFALLTPHLAAMLVVPGDVGGILRGPTLLALSFAAKQGAGAPPAVLAYLRGLLDLRQVDGHQFPAEARIGELLRGASTSEILDAVGRGEVAAPIVEGAPPEARITRHNLSAAHGGRNDTTVQSVTLAGRINAADTPVYVRPDGDEAARLADTTAVFIHGKIGDQWYAIERGQTIAFVRQNRVTVA